MVFFPSKDTHVYMCVYVEREGEGEKERGEGGKKGGREFLKYVLMTITLLSKELCKDIKPQMIHASLYLCHTVSKVTIKHKEEKW